jgi:hypothetical protein
METYSREKRKAKVYTEEDVKSLVETNRILKEHLDFLRVKLRKSENLLELYIRAQEAKEDSRNKINYSLN